MAFPNSAISDIVATTIQNRSRRLADNVTKNNALLAWLKSSGNVKTFGGGTEIYQEFLFAENGNFGWFSGYEPLPIAPADVISGANFPIKQAACAVVISGLERLQNSGREQMIDLLEGRISAAEATMQNNISAALYSDGTGYGGKQLDGLAAAILNTGVYGGIDRGTWAFWQSKYSDKTANDAASTTIGPIMNDMYVSLVRGADKPNLILADAVAYTGYLEACQAIQRVTSAKAASLGFTSLQYMDCDVVLDGGIGGFCPTGTMFFLNTKYLFYRPHRDCNMVPLGPKTRVPVNQDAEIQIIGFAGNVTCSGAQFQGKIDFNG